MNAKTLASLLRASDLNGFTKLIHGQRLERYVIAFTHCGDEKGDIEKIATKLTATIECLPKNINLTIGGWKDAKTGKLYIDLGTSSDSLSTAKRLGKQFNQIAIWDTKRKEEIRL